MADSHVKWLCAVKGTDTDSETFMRAVCVALEAFAEYGVGAAVRQGRQGGARVAASGIGLRAC